MIRVNAAIAERTIDIEGLPTRYLTAGSGPPLVLVHGVGTSAGEWSWVLPALARSHLVYAIDLPGFDSSARPPDYSPAFSALPQRVPRCLGGRAPRGARQLARRPRGPAPGALRAGARLCARLVRQRGAGPSGESCSGGAQFTRRRRASGDVGQDASWRDREGIPEGAAPLRASLADPPKVARGPVPAGANAELHGSDVGFPTREHRSCRTTRRFGGPTPSPNDADAYRVGSRGQGVPLLARERGGHPPARGFVRTPPRLRPPASRRATTTLRVYRGPIPRRNELQWRCVGIGSYRVRRRERSRRGDGKKRSRSQQPQEKGSPMTTVHLKPVEEQVVALMGASSGIGREAALRFAKQGAKVVVSARGEEGLDSLAEEIRREGGEGTPMVADTSDFEQVKAVADRAVEEYGRLDTWVHLAAVGLFATFEQTTPEEFERVIDVNLMGQVYGAMAALPHLKREGRGALIHISSVEAKRSL